MPTTALIYFLRLHWEAIRNSYTQVFFSNHPWFGVLLLLVTFLDINAGASALWAIVVTHGLAWWIGIRNEAGIRSGIYGYNSLMLGLVMGTHYQMGWIYLLLLTFGAFITLLFCIWVKDVLHKYNIPFLSLPFLLSVWVMMLAIRNYEGIHLSERGIYTDNELSRWGGIALVQFNDYLEAFPLPKAIEVYFKSLGAIFFQYRLLSGMLIAIGLLYYSRIASVLSIIGYTIGYQFYSLVDQDFNPLTYSYIGFDFILLSIALGGFFLIPSFKSYVLVALAAPVTAILISALNEWFEEFQLPIYTLPFTVVVILVLFLLNHRMNTHKPELVYVQLFSPERNLYGHLFHKDRFEGKTWLDIQLPFFGTWMVSQGYDGQITHKDDWKCALDFVVVDDTLSTYKVPGHKVEDYYCYNLPVLAPASGVVVELADGIEDNLVGDVNLTQNWGNTIIIKHAEYLYSKLSHLKKGSFRVKIGDYVQTGDILALCGSSGRSPEPHLHFQMQSTPLIGSPALYYPISGYVRSDGAKYTFHNYEVPGEGMLLQKLQTNELMRRAFHFIPGQRISWEVRATDYGYRVTWEVRVNSLNQSYFYCLRTKAIAYFTNNGSVFQFTEFYGNRDSFLYDVYLALNKVVLGQCQDMKTETFLPLDLFVPKGMLMIHDVTAPFFRYIDASYSSWCQESDNIHQPDQVKMKAIVTAHVKKVRMKSYEFGWTIGSKGIEEMNLISSKQKFSAKCISTL